MRLLSSALARGSARLEATLSTHAFLYLTCTLYAFTTTLFILAGFRSEWTKDHNPVMRWFIGLARAAGYALNFNTAVLLLLASRLFHTLLRITPFANLLPLDHFFPRLHILVAYVIAIALLVHVPAHFVWIIKWNGWAWGLWDINMTVITGILLLIIFLVFIVFSRPSFRTNHFRAFRLIHIIGASLFFPLLILHGMYNKRPETYKYVVPAMLIYFLDRLVRHLARSSHEVCTNLNPAESAFLNPSVLRLRLPRSFNFRPGQYAELRVPSLGREWHPFTIASAPHDETLTFYIKDLGDWTHALHTAVRARLEEDDVESGSDGDQFLPPLSISVRGPFGAPAQQFDEYSRVILISGGIGATPFASICRHIHNLSKKSTNIHYTGTHSHTQCTNESSSSSCKANPSSNAIEGRIRSAVSGLFDVDVAAADPYGAVEQRGNQVAELLRLGNRRATFSALSAPREHVLDPNRCRSANDISPGDVDNLDVALSDIDVSEIGASEVSESPRSSLADEDSRYNGSMSELTPPTIYKKSENVPHASFFDKPYEVNPTRRVAHRQLARVDEKMTHLLQFLHTTRVTFVLVLLLIARAAVAVAGVIFESDFVKLQTSTMEGPTRGVWVVIAQTALFAPLVITLPTLVILEMSFVGLSVISSARRFGEVVLFLPVTIGCFVLEIRRWAIGEQGSNIEILLRYGVVLPLTLIALCGRMWRSIGRRGLLARAEDEGGECCECGRSGTPEVDFVWTTPKFEEDRWLRNEISELCDGDSKIRLHRYATREREVGEEDVEEGENGWQTHTGRPDWESILGQVAMEVESDGVVGIFFCGPHAMGKSVRETAKKMEMWSNLKGAYLRTTDVKVLMDDLRLSSPKTVEKLKKTGCRVRFVYREENFN